MASEGRELGVGMVEGTVGDMGEQQWVLKELEADWASELRLQRVHPLRRDQAGTVSAKSREAAQLSAEGTRMHLAPNYILRLNTATL